MSKIVARFAPSPTGYLHIGGARTALYNYLFARHEGGTFILRIEDTDRTRSTDEAIAAILDGLKWLGINWDEGPVFQSKRLDLYNRAVEKLLSEGKAYHTKDEEKGQAVRFKMGEGITEVDDLIHGKISFDVALMEDFVIQKADGFPTYNFACVIDDHEMGITHVIRGDDHISNTPSQLALYEALDYEPPEYAHIPMILAEDGSRLSKRHGAPYVGVYRKQGYLPEATANFLALLGWSPGNDQEVMSRDEMIRMFSLDRVKRTSSRFNAEKFLWLNGIYIKKLSSARLVEFLKPFIQEAGHDLAGVSDKWLNDIVELYRERFRTLREFVERTGFFFEREVSYDHEVFQESLLRDGAKELLAGAREALENVGDFTPDELERCLRSACDASGVKFKDLAQPLRVAVTGTRVSAGLFEILSLLGRERVIDRLNRAIDMI